MLSKIPISEADVERQASPSISEASKHEIIEDTTSDKSMYINSSNDRIRRISPLTVPLVLAQKLLEPTRLQISFTMLEQSRLKPMSAVVVVTSLGSRVCQSSPRTSPILSRLGLIRPRSLSSPHCVSNFSSVRRKRKPCSDDTLREWQNATQSTCPVPSKHVAVPQNCQS